MEQLAAAPEDDANVNERDDGLAEERPEDDLPSAPERVVACGEVVLVSLEDAKGDSCVLGPVAFAGCAVAVAAAVADGDARDDDDARRGMMMSEEVVAVEVRKRGGPHADEEVEAMTKKIGDDDCDVTE